MAMYSLETKRSDYTEDVYYFDFSGCLSNTVRDITGLPDSDPTLVAGTYERDGVVYTWGEIHSTDTDNDVWCKGCGDFICHGLECECEDRETEREPLTEDKLAKL